MNDHATTHSHAKLPCHVCGRLFRRDQLRSWVSVQPGISRLIDDAAPGWTDGKFICREDLSKFRHSYIEHLLKDEHGTLSRRPMIKPPCFAGMTAWARYATPFRPGSAMRRQP
ncbi:hypothetical protein [Paracoccus pacificus]|uniref:Uncharacterized protein n=1 Tax=Paracoccus pacificus TaxID=1463598 RepID=A0ABW4R963_9RHOB